MDFPDVSKYYKYIFWDLSESDHYRYKVPWEREEGLGLNNKTYHVTKSRLE